MDAYINKQLEFANRMNVLANFGQNDALVLEAQRMQEFRNHILSEGVQVMAAGIKNLLIEYQPFVATMIKQNLLRIIADFSVINFYPEDISEEEKKETEEVSNKIISEILKPEKKKIQTEDAAIIKVLPVNERLLQYLAENPNDWYNLKPRQFELAMAEIYTKLGYKVKITPETRDGGKDLIIIDNRGLGDLMYYVECKHYKPESHVGIGFIQRLHGVVNSDRVNGGILATTSFFSKPAREFVLENKLECQIKLQDYNNIQDLLKMAVG